MERVAGLYTDTGALTVRRPELLELLGADWGTLLSREGINPGLLASALAEAAAAMSGSARPPVAIRHGGALLEDLLTALDQAGFSEVALEEPDGGLPGDPGTPPRLGIDAYFAPYRMQGWSPAPGWISLLDPRVIHRYRTLRRRHLRWLTDRLSHWSAAPQPVVVFVAPKTYFNHIRFSQALRRRGWRTVAVSFDAANHAPKAGYFDENIVTDLYSLLRAMAALPADATLLLHTQGWLFRYHVPVLIDACRPPGVRLVVEMMDSNRFWLEHERKHLAQPLMRAAWGPEVLSHHERQLRCEQHVMRWADGVLFPGDRAFGRKLAPEWGGGHRHIPFCSYPLTEFFAPARFPRRYDRAEDARLVFLGGVTPINDRHPPGLFHDSQMVRTAQRLLQQGLRLDLFNNPLRAPGTELRQVYAPHFELAEHHPGRYGFYTGDLPEAINRRIAGYHFGLMLYDLDGLLVGDDHFRHLIPTKFFQYLEAGLPVLVSDRWAAVCALVRRYGIGLVVDRAGLLDLAPLLEQADYGALRRNVYRARQVLSMDRQLHRLTALYLRVTGPGMAPPPEPSRGPHEGSPQ